MNNKAINRIVNYLNNEFGYLEPYFIDECPKSVFYMKDGITIFEYNEKSGEVFVSEDHVWSLLKSFFGLEFSEIAQITSHWINTRYSLEVTKSIWGVQLLWELPESYYQENLSVCTEL
jgi:hypothetical protein